jgi:uncharacterized membrane protein
MILSNFIALFNLPVGLWKKFILLAFAFFFITAGLDHFTNREFYLSIMPPPFPLHLEAVLISGFFEILGGFGLLIPKLRKFAAWGLLALLISVYPANIYMALNPDEFIQYPVILLYFRLALQFIAFYWAYILTTEPFNPSTN